MYKRQQQLFPGGALDQMRNFIGQHQVFARNQAKHLSLIHIYGLVVAAFAVLQILSAGGGISSSLQGMLVPICAYVVMAISLNLTVGILGELSLGHAGFMSVGAFAGVVRCV